MLYYSHFEYCMIIRKSLFLNGLGVVSLSIFFRTSEVPLSESIGRFGIPFCFILCNVGAQAPCIMYTWMINWDFHKSSLS
jgi:hypothetical protein